MAALDANYPLNRPSTGETTSITRDIGYAQMAQQFHTFALLNICLTINASAALDGISGYGVHRSIPQLQLKFQFSKFVELIFMKVFIIVTYYTVQFKFR